MSAPDGSGAAFQVTGASESHVNGNYHLYTRAGGQPAFVKFDDSGRVVVLVRRRSQEWCFVSDGAMVYSTTDLPHTRNLPPQTGWSHANDPNAVLPTFTVLPANANRTAAEVSGRVNTGSLIILKGIVQAPEKNGKLCRVVAYREVHARYLVRMVDAPDSVHLVQRSSFDIVVVPRQNGTPDSAQVQRGTLCTLQGLTPASATYNGKICRVEGFNELHRRHQITLLEDDESTFLVKRRSLQPLYRPSTAERKAAAALQPIPMPSTANDMRVFRVPLHEKFSSAKVIRGSEHLIDIEQTLPGVVHVEVLDTFFRLYTEDFTVEEFALCYDKDTASKAIFIASHDTDLSAVTDDEVSACLGALYQVIDMANHRKDRRKLFIKLTPPRFPRLIMKRRKPSPTKTQALPTHNSFPPIQQEPSKEDSEDEDHGENNLRMDAPRTGALRLPCGLAYRSSKQLRGAQHKIFLDTRTNGSVCIRVKDNLFKEHSRVFDPADVLAILKEEEKGACIAAAATAANRERLLEAIVTAVVLVPQKKDPRKATVGLERTRTPRRVKRKKVSTPKVAQVRRVVYVPSPTRGAPPQEEKQEGGDRPLQFHDRLSTPEEGSYPSWVQETMHFAATQINALARGHLDRKMLALMELDIVLQESAIVIQKHARGYLARVRVGATLQEASESLRGRDGLMMVEDAQEVAPDPLPSSRWQETVLAPRTMSPLPIPPTTDQGEVDDVSSRVEEISVHPVPMLEIETVSSVMRDTKEQRTGTPTPARPFSLETSPTRDMETQTSQRRGRRRQKSTRGPPTKHNTLSHLTLGRTNPHGASEKARRKKKKRSISPVMKIVYDVLKQSKSALILPKKNQREMADWPVEPYGTTTTASPYNSLPFPSQHGETVRSILDKSISSYTKRAVPTLRISASAPVMPRQTKPPTSPIHHATDRGKADSLTHSSQKHADRAKQNAVVTQSRLPGFSFSQHVANEVEQIERREKKLPGPGQYDTGLAFVPNPGAGRISDAHAKNDVDWSIHRARTVPGPGEYTLSTFGSDLKGGRFSTAFPPTSQEIVARKGARLPGPADYQHTLEYKPSNNIGKISSANPKSDVEWKVYHAQQVPGPGAYKATRFGHDSRGIYIGTRYKDVAHEKPKSMMFEFAGPYDRVESMGKQADSQRKTRGQHSFCRPHAQSQRRRLPLHLAIAQRLEKKKLATAEVYNSVHRAEERVQMKKEAHDREQERRMIMSLRGMTPNSLKDATRISLYLS